VKNVGFSIEQFNQEFVRITCMPTTLALNFAKIDLQGIPEDFDYV
jgi:hypothetical protein